MNLLAIRFRVQFGQDENYTTLWEALKFEKSERYKQLEE